MFLKELIDAGRKIKVVTRFAEGFKVLVTCDDVFTVEKAGLW